MDISTAFWMGLAIAGFVIGLWVPSGVVLRIAIALLMLTGLGMLLANTWGSAGLAWWFGAGFAALVVVFGVAFIGSLAGSVVRRMVHREPQRRGREYNSILQ
ncbi:hypothetical protein [Ramlibacter albus]|uniref:Uncharacterized protein n=1 Tax=Ramlibacter albus TaxID=2079448 RepID=A0A923MBG9_9BURK|nr:hypothetical protein [Ramlibacter albus]MBC5766318.1 hypothetical protein [Ramlibacter albus]